MNASLFDSYGELVMPGDIVRLTGGYCAIYQQASTLYAGKHGKIERIGEFCFPFTDKPDQSGELLTAIRILLCRPSSDIPPSTLPDNMSRVQWVQQDKDTWVPKNTGPGTPLPPGG